MYLHFLSFANAFSASQLPIRLKEKLIIEMTPDRIVINPEIVAKKFQEFEIDVPNNLLTNVIQTDFWIFSERTTFFVWCKRYSEFYDWLRDEVFLKYKDEINPYLLQLFKYQYEQFGKKFEINEPNSEPAPNIDESMISVTENGIIFSKEYICKALGVDDISDELYTKFKYLTKKTTKTALSKKFQEHPQMAKFYHYFMKNEAFFLVEFQKFHPKIYRLLLWINFYISK